MSSWHNIENEADEAWWELAYKLFLRSNPKETICHHSAFYVRNDKWNDYGFNCDTRVPPAGKFNGVSKRAILVVISRERKMEWGDWKTLRSPTDLPDVPDLDETDKNLINCVTDLIYKEDGSPRPFVNEVE